MNKDDEFESVTWKSEISYSLNETLDDFILTSMMTYINNEVPKDVLPRTDMVIPKKYIVRALQCFNEEHQEEAIQIMREAEARLMNKNSKTMEFRKYEGPKDV